ncbi:MULTISPECIES: ketopantoate reductase family protein [unclassified Oceanobacter]|jgi:2-dehydropantoate 2-reductase|uniref:ketopantoate reductase family protein n=1 Tax=unclassified Oceanobacter TaxID=2620260 RepID=UPI0026E2A8BC|nr:MULTISPECIES: 2-dehydropantoate 2-reductase [unclassified Oceanobacter]MDO6683178.1 2-dehydropantoate 2-reductase [Oceanobacter sp. 5_MG-2023]MDP2609476.1 2-dehydropantoate 2-reductase [Oceanobacter sp. 1_MG-2023]MDP2612824.1 2-dehydropantoate 2-reductase [Oceanobacter sp. 2_MG-2023]
MNISVIGAGAIGGYIAARLASIDVRVNLIARGATLAALQQHGIGLQEGDQPPAFFSVNAVADATSLPSQDLIIVAVKEPALASVLPHIQALMGPNTRVMTAMNGIPWWFTAGLVSGQSIHLGSLDPQAALQQAIPSSQIIGCVLHMACSNVRTGVIRHSIGHRMVLGSPGQQPDAGLHHIANLLNQAGFEASLSDYIQRDIWFKLWGNMTHNPVSALTHATTDQIINDPYTSQLVVRVMAEAQQVGCRIGCDIDQDPVERNREALKLGAFKTSMLQDVEANRPLEINALLGAFCDLAQQLSVAVPCAESLFGLVRLMDRNRNH